MKIKNLIKTLIFRNTWVAATCYRAWDAVRSARYLKNPTAFGQCREDEWFLYWLKENGAAATGTYVDIGANHPVIFSATYLLYRHGWRGVTVEPIPSLCQAHRKIRPRDTCINAGVGKSGGEAEFWETVPHVFSSFSQEDAKSAEKQGYCRILPQVKVPIFTPKQVLEKSKLNPKSGVDYLSIDTEGLDLMILENWPIAECAPRIISCEAGTGGGHADEVGAFFSNAGYELLNKFHTVSYWALKRKND